MFCNSSLQWSLCLISILLIVHAKTTYRVLIDSGSTGSRVYIYSYDLLSPLSTLEEVAHLRSRPALAFFYQKSADLHAQLTQLISFAEEHVPPAWRSETRIALKATAGLRIIDEEKRDWIMNNVKSILSQSSFAFDPVETKVLTGEEEALFGLLATNLAYGNFSDHKGLTLAAADLGGSSKQIAFMLPGPEPYKITLFGHEFEVPLSVSSSSVLGLGWWFRTGEGESLMNSGDYPLECKPDYQLILPGSHKHVHIFARSVPGLGLVEAMQETMNSLSKLPLFNGIVKVPSSMIGSNRTENEKGTEIRSDTELENHIVVFKASREFGEADWNEETILLEDMVAEVAVSSVSSNSKVAPVVEHYKSYSGDHHNILNPCAPPGERLKYSDDIAHLPWVGTGDFDGCVKIVKKMITRKASREILCMKRVKVPTIIAMDNFPKVLEIMKVANDEQVTPGTIKSAGRTICQQPWTEIMKDFDNIPEYRAQQACFGAAFIYAVTTELYGLSDLDRTSFLPTDTHHSYTIGWPLGATIYSALGINAAEAF